MINTMFLVAIAQGAIILWAIFSYNRLVSLKFMVQEAWSGIDVQLKRRHDLIPNLVETVKGYSIHEKSIIDEIVHMRAASMGAAKIEDKERAELGLSGALKSLFALAEAYPNLKANENFATLQKELATIESELQLSRRYYNGVVRSYNIAIQQFPANLIAKQFGFKVESYFEIQSAERNNPTVKF